jgi:hypothetical protein
MIVTPGSISRASQSMRGLQATGPNCISQFDFNYAGWCLTPFPLAKSCQISELLVRTREIIVASKELLAEPAPSTFLGRKSFEPFAQVVQQPFAIESMEIAGA